MASILGSFYKTQRLLRKNKLFGRGLALQFLRLQLLQSFVYKFVPTNHCKALGQNFHFFRFKQFLSLFEEIYIGQPYQFDSAKPNPVILDCGANIGVATLFFKKLYPGARILSFEPDPNSYAVLQKNIAENHLTDCAAFNVALSNREGSLDFYYDPSDPGNLCMSLDQARMDKASIKVPAKKLSDYITGEVDYAKIDVEGAEHDVLSDLIAANKLTQIKQLFIEYHHHIRGGENRLGEFLSLLERHGFGYQLSSPGVANPPKAGKFQDVLIYAYHLG